MTRALRSRRQVGGYEWGNSLEDIKGMGETLTRELVKLGKQARTVETANRITHLVSISSQIAVRAMELQDYKP